jgi:hypothetical protein
MTPPIHRVHEDLPSDTFICNILCKTRKGWVSFGFLTEEEQQAFLRDIKTQIPSDIFDARVCQGGFRLRDIRALPTLVMREDVDFAALRAELLDDLHNDMTLQQGDE